MFKKGFAAVIACTLMQLGCESAPTPAVVPTWHANVKPIIEAYCQECHVAGGLAPFEFSKPEQLVAMKASLINDLQKRVMPPWAADSHVRKYRYDESLTDKQIATVVDWLNNAAPLGDPSKPGAAIKIARSTLGRKDFTFKMPVAYKPLTKPDDYRCFVVPWTEKTDKYVTGFGVNPGNRKIAHHAVLFAVGADDAAVIDKLDAAEPGDGYTCYGGPVPGEEGKSVNAQFLSAWAPGMTGIDFPAGTGLRIKPGTKLILQMHYNMNGDATGTDQTEIHLALADKVDNQAWFMPWFDLNWFFDPASMGIKAGDAKASHQFIEVPAAANVTQATLPDASLKDGFTIHSVFPHMHTRGKTMHFSRVPAVGKEETLLDVFRWDFNWQRIYFLDQPARVNKGDKLNVQCIWDNSAAGQPMLDGKPMAVQELKWGEGTYDEMCIAFLYLTLK